MNTLNAALMFVGWLVLYVALAIVAGLFCWEAYRTLHEARMRRHARTAAH